MVTRDSKPPRTYANVQMACQEYHICGVEEDAVDMLHTLYRHTCRYVKTAFGFRLTRLTHRLRHEEAAVHLQPKQTKKQTKIADGLSDELAMLHIPYKPHAEMSRQHLVSGISALLTGCATRRQLSILQPKNLCLD